MKLLLIVLMLGCGTDEMEGKEVRQIQMCKTGINILVRCDAEKGIMDGGK